MQNQYYISDWSKLPDELPPETDIKKITYNPGKLGIYFRSNHDSDSPDLTVGGGFIFSDDECILKNSRFKGIGEYWSSKPNALDCPIEYSGSPDNFELTFKKIIRRNNQYHSFNLGGIELSSYDTCEGVSKEYVALVIETIYPPLIGKFNILFYIPDNVDKNKLHISYKPYVKRGPGAYPTFVTFG